MNEFDIHRPLRIWNLSPQLNRFSDHVAKKLGCEATDELRSLTVDLLICQRENPVSWISVSLSNRGYTKVKSRYQAHRNKKNLVGQRYRYNPAKISNSIIPIIKEMEVAGLIELKKGFLDRETKRAFRTRIRASKALLDIFNKYDLNIYNIEVHKGLETLELKDKEGQLLNYSSHSEPKWASASRELLKEYNSLLQKSFIDVPELERSVITTSRQGKLVEISVAPSCPFVKRVFNNSRWDRGGRFYGGFWQNMPHRTKYDPETGEKLNLPNRSRICINDKPCIERDFSGLHIVLLYARKGIDYWTSGLDDPYTVPDPIFPDYNRQLGKLMMLYSINASDEKKAFAALNNQLRDDGLPTLKLANFQEHFEQLRDKHQTIDEFFFTGVGLELQFTSQIAESVSKPSPTKKKSFCHFMMVLLSKKKMKCSFATQWTEPSVKSQVLKPCGTNPSG